MNEFLAIVESLLKYVNGNNINEFISMIENLVSIAENIQADIQKLESKK